MQTSEEIAEQIAASEKFAGLTLDDLGLSVEEMMVAAVEADRAQRVAGDNETLEFDARFPSRPQHPDMARLSSALNEQDAVADILGIDQALKLDSESAVYVARQRMAAMGFVALPPEIETRIVTLYLDALHLGIGFTERGGTRHPEQTGTAGEGSSS